LMLASGAISTPTVEARYLASGMTEACRISLFDLIEKDVFQARDPVVLQSALHFTTLAAWSGDKWHMDVSPTRGLDYCSARQLTLSYRSQWDNEECIWRYVYSTSVRVLEANVLYRC
jgi:hypothetical protein